LLLKSIYQHIPVLIDSSKP